MTETIENKTVATTNVAASVLKAVRAVGIIKPRFDPQHQNFIPPQLDVIGTAFLLKEYNTIITCAHVVKQFINLPVELGGVLAIGKDTNYQPVGIDSIDFIHDLAILRLRNTQEMPEEEFESKLKIDFQNGLSIADNYPNVSDKVMYAGYPLGNILLNEKHEPSYSEGVVSICKRTSGFGKKEIQISGNIVGGFSGSPVVLKNTPEKIVGIVSNSPNKEAGNAGIFMIISWEHIAVLAKLANS